METDSQSIVCLMCGVVGYPEVLVTCCQCKQLSEHIYCLVKETDFVQDNWRCEECLANNQVSRTTMESEKVCSKFDTHRTTPVSSSPRDSEEKPTQCSEEPRLNNHGSQSAIEPSCRILDIGNTRSHGRLAKQLTVPSKTVQISKEQLIPCDQLMMHKARASSCRQSVGSSLARTNQEAHMQASLSQMDCRDVSSSKIPSPQNVRTKVPEVQVSLSKSTLRNVINVKEEKLQTIASGKRPGVENKKVKWGDSVGCKGLPIKEEPMEECVNIRSKDPSLKTKCVLATSVSTNSLSHKLVGDAGNSVPQFNEVASPINGPPAVFFVVSDSEHQNHPVKERLWMGDFEVSGIVSFVYDGIQAHVGSSASPKAHTMLTQLPKRMKFKLLRRLDLWPRSFQSNPPDTNDIALYFFPSELHRSKENYVNLLEGIDNSDLAMQSCVGDVELLVFSSTQLLRDSPGLPMKFLWGVFRQKKMHHRQQFPAQSHAASAGCKQSTTAFKAQTHVPLVENVFRGSIDLKSNDEVKMKVDLDSTRTNIPTGGISKCSIVPTSSNGPISEWDGPPIFIEPCNRREDCGNKPRVRGNLSRWDISPGFPEPFIKREECERSAPKHVPSDFSETLLRRLDCEKKPEAYVTLGRSEGPIPGMDFPPGFPEPYSRTTDHEKMLNSQGKLMMSNISEGPPGFSKPNNWKNCSSSLQGKGTDLTFLGKDTDWHSPSSREVLLMRNVPASQTPRERL